MQTVISALSAVAKRLAIVFAGPVLALALGSLTAAAEEPYDSYPDLDGKIVRQILILGNNHTQRLVFLREMRTQAGEPFSSRALGRDRERLVDLGIFAQLEVAAVPSAEGVLVVISVYERPRTFVAPVVDYDPRRKTLEMGYTFRLRNIAGYNRTFRTKGVFGDRNVLSASWSTPWLGSRRLSVFTDARLELPRPDQAELRTSRAGLGATKYLGDYKEVRKGVTGYGRLEVLRREGTHPDGPIKQLSPVVGTLFFRDGRNVRIDPTRGTLLASGVEYASGWTSDDLNYLRTSFDGRIFVRTLKRTVLALRGLTILSTGQIPEYRRLGIGGGSSIRGQPTDVDFDKSIGRASVEWRFPLVGQRRFVLPIPLIPKRISNVDLRIDGAVFFDAGSAWGNSVGFRSARVRTGAGVGLRVFLPVLEVGRLEIAFDESGNPTFYVIEGNLI